MIELAILFCICIVFAARGLLSSDKLFEYPTAMSLLFIAFFVPQVVAIERSYISTAYDAWFSWLYISACLLMAAIGFYHGKRKAQKHARRIPNVAVEENRLIVGAIAFVVVGLFSAARVRGIVETSDDLGSQWTGVITFWYLLVQTTFFGFAIAALRYLKTGRSIHLIVGSVALVSALILVSGNVKRSLIAEIFIILGGAWFFIKGRQPPKVAVVAVCILGTVLLHQVGAVRAYLNEGKGGIVDAFIEGVPFERFEYFYAERAPELTQGIIDIYAASKYGELEGFSEIWNKLAHQYVPAFIFGYDFKESVKFSTNSQVESSLVLSHYSSSGATRTGFSDTYRGFSFAGCFVFLLLGMLMGHLYGYAIAGRIWAQFYYLVLLNDSLFALTESVARFVSILPFLFIVSWVFVRPPTRGGTKSRRAATHAAVLPALSSSPGAIKSQALLLRAPRSY